MFVYFIQHLLGAESFSSISFRLIMAVITAFMISIWLVPILISHFNDRKIGQNIRQDGPKSHLSKEGCPTMGGLVIVISILTTTLFWAKPYPLLLLSLAVLLALSAIGFVDDFRKYRNKSSDGLSARQKILGQALVALSVGYTVQYFELVPDYLFIPLTNWRPILGYLFVPFITLVLVGTSNAVNLTDGLDGLAGGILFIVSLVFAGFSYISGHAILAGHLKIPNIQGAGELAVFCSSMAGAVLGFLWYNVYPAQVFMGDVGSLALGGAIGAVAVFTKTELILLVIGGIFVLEALSVILQVASFRLRRTRIFKMAPIHHHFELSGWAEPKVVLRFWIISLILVLVGLSFVGLNTIL